MSVCTHCGVTEEAPFYEGALIGKFRQLSYELGSIVACTSACYDAQIARLRKPCEARPTGVNLIISPGRTRGVEPPREVPRLPVIATTDQIDARWELAREAQADLRGRRIFPYVSVIVPTMRVGGIDVLLAGLVRQDFKNFELILVDGVPGRAANYPTPTADHNFLRFVEPFGNPFPQAAFCRYSNTGLVHARGRIVLFLVDYTWLPPHAVGAHAAWHWQRARAGEAPAGLMMPHQYRALPPLDRRFPGYAFDQAGTARYAEDVRTGRLQWAARSIFQDPFIGPATAHPLDESMAWTDPKLKYPAGAVDPTYFHGKNESVPLEVLLAANGWDEDLDETHGYQDSDLADRLTVRHNLTWHLEHLAIAEIVNPRKVFPPAAWKRPYETNQKVWEDKRAVGYTGLVNHWNLREAHWNLREAHWQAPTRT